MGMMKHNEVVICSAMQYRNLSEDLFKVYHEIKPVEESTGFRLSKNLVWFKGRSPLAGLRVRSTLAI